MTISASDGSQGDTLRRVRRRLLFVRVFCVVWAILLVCIVVRVRSARAAQCLENRQTIEQAEIRYKHDHGTYATGADATWTLEQAGYMRPYTLCGPHTRLSVELDGHGQVHVYCPTHSPAPN